MSSSPSSPRPHRSISSQGALSESEAMTSGASIASHLRSTSRRTVEDGGEEASHIDQSLDSSTEVGLEFGDDGYVRLVLLSSGEGGDRQSRLLPDVSEKRNSIPVVGSWDSLSVPESGLAYYDGIFHKVREDKKSSKQEQETKPSQITKPLAKIFRWMLSIFKKKKHTDTLGSSTEKAAGRSLTSGQRNRLLILDTALPTSALPIYSLMKNSTRLLTASSMSSLMEASAEHT